MEKVSFPFYIGYEVFMTDDPKSFEPESYIVKKIEIEEDFTNKRVMWKAILKNKRTERYINELDVEVSVFSNKFTAQQKIKDNYKDFPRFVGEKIFLIYESEVYESRISRIRNKNQNTEIRLELINTDDDDGYEIETTCFIKDIGTRLFFKKQEAIDFLKKQ